MAVNKARSISSCMENSFLQY
uniref:Uncharacterized protein n=1 Tax=Anguilla anguilla TaxID=7936 RepID=A0A0E9PNC7_ANGAN